MRNLRLQSISLDSIFTVVITVLSILVAIVILYSGYQFLISEIVKLYTPPIHINYYQPQDNVIKA